jgi:hypothetical protein
VSLTLAAVAVVDCLQLLLELVVPEVVAMGLQMETEQTVQLI